MTMRQAFKKITISLSKILFLSSLLLCGCSLYIHAQIITTIAGIGPSGPGGTFSGDGSPAIFAGLSNPGGIAIDTSGTILFVDYGNRRIRKITPAGIITTIAGNGTLTDSGDGGPATAAGLLTPWGLALDHAGNIYVTNNSGRVRKISPAGIITTFAGNGTFGHSGDGGPATAAQLESALDITVDVVNNVYFSDGNLIRKVDAAGTITTIAGAVTAGFSGDGGPATAARLNAVHGVKIDGTGNLYIVDRENLRVRMIDPSGIITTIAGTGVLGYTGDGGPATLAKLCYPEGVTIDSAGNIYLTDCMNYAVRVINTAGIITTIAGTGWLGFSGDGGPATAAQLYRPSLMAIKGGNMYITDGWNHRIRMISPNNHAPRYTGPHLQTTLACADFISLGALLAVRDSDVAQTVAWTAVYGPLHGVVTLPYSMATTGGVIVPSGILYAPASGYSGPDTIIVRATDAFSSDTTIIAITAWLPPVVGPITGPSDVCRFDSIVLADTTLSGTWSGSGSHALVSGGHVFGLSAGPDTVYYSRTNICGTTTISHPVMVLDCTLGETSSRPSPGEVLRVWPNPNEGAFFVELNSGSLDEVRVVVTNTVGEKVKEMTVPANKPTEIKMDMAPGVYFLSVLTADGSFREKVVLSK